jgi:hypothetical protein
MDGVATIITTAAAARNIYSLSLLPLPLSLLQLLLLLLFAPFFLCT